jgi:pyridoxamine 5'-phosphate oxidase
MVDLAGERTDYSGRHLIESEVPGDPLILFDAWLADAFAARTHGTLAEPSAMVVSTVSEGRPRSRTVLLKEATATGFVFFTNYDSDKGIELGRNPAVALLFGWFALQRQVRIEGSAVRVDRAESEAYFATRPRGSQLGAWASAQSSEVASAEDLAESYRRAEARFAGSDVTCPPHWGGYRVAAESMEFWQGQPSRMHDRLRYRRSGTGWTITRLAP